MVTYRDVGERHAVYAAGVLSIVLFAEYTVLLTTILIAALVGIKWHMGTPPMFSMMVCTVVPLGVSMCIKLSVHTWWYARGVPLLAIPPWLPPLHGLLAHWALDAYWLVTLRDARRVALP